MNNFPPLPTDNSKNVPDVEMIPSSGPVGNDVHDDHQVPVDNLTQSLVQICTT